MIQKKYVTNKAFLCPCNLQYNNLLKTWQYLCILCKPFISPQLIFLGETNRGKKKRTARLENWTANYWKLNLRITVNILKQSSCRIFQVLLCYMKEYAWECSPQFIYVNPQSPFIAMLLWRELFHSHHKLFSKNLSEI